jgi:hypothetical protein
MELGRIVLRFLFLGATSALVVALATRVAGEIVGPYRRDRSERIEVDRPALPGISVRA